MADATPDDADRRAQAVLVGLKLWDDVESELTDRIAAAIREAVGAERERCAKVTDDYSAGFEAVQAAEGRGWCPKCGEYVRDVADDIGRAIRGTGAPVPPAPAWTRTPPTAPGWYWTRTDAGEVEPVLVAESPTGTWWANGNRLTEYADREWCGPIEAPA